MFCKKCGTEIGNEVKYCPKCGAAVGEKKKGAETRTPAPAPKSPSDKKKLLAAATVLAVLAVVGVIALIVHITSPEYRSGKCVKKAEEYMQEEAFQEAIEVYREALEYLPENTTAKTGLEDAYLGVAGALYQEADYEAAMEHYEMVKGLNPERFEVYLGESDIYLQSEDVVAALDVLEEGREFVSGNVLVAREEYIKERTVVVCMRSENKDDVNTYEYDAGGNVIKSVFYNTDGSIRDWYEYEYDVDGYEIIKINYNADGSISGWIGYDYDAGGNEIKRISCGADNLFNSNWYEIEYDAGGNEIKKINYDKYGRIINWQESEYDTGGNEIKKVHYDKDGRIINWQESEYDARGNEIKRVYYNVDGSISHWMEYEYNAGGNEIKEVLYSADGSSGSWREYEYDAEGNEIKEVLYRADGSIIRWYEYEYSIRGIHAKGYIELEDKGDCYLIKSVEYDADGSVEAVILDCEVTYIFME